MWMVDLNNGTVNLLVKVVVTEAVIVVVVLPLSFINDY